MIKRIEWIDIGKGIGILLVIMGHAISEFSFKYDFLLKMIYSMHMPLFFILSGYTFKIGKKNFKEYISSKIKRIMIPYLLFSLLIFLCHIVETIVLNKKVFFIKLFSYKGILNTVLLTTESVFSNLWFLPCILLSSILFYLILKNVNGKVYSGLICTILGIVSFLYGKYVNYSLPFCFETSLLGVFYLYIGNSLSEMTIFKKKYLFFFFSFIIFIGFNYLNFIYKGVFSFYNLKFTYPFIFLGTSLFGTLNVMFISYLSKTNFILEFIGQKSIYIYGYHFISQNIIQIVMKILKIDCTGLFSLFLLVIVNVGISVGIYYFINFVREDIKNVRKKIKWNSNSNI